MKTSTEKKGHESISPMEKMPPLNSRMRINHWSLFCPEKILDNLVSFFHLFRHFGVLLPFMFVFALVGLIMNFHLYKMDLLKVSLKFNFVEHTIYILFTINLLTVIVRGCIARHFHLGTPSFGFMFAFGLIPEFDIRIDVHEDTNKKTRLWLCSASILTRFFLISLGIILWLITRPRGTSLSVLSAALVWYSVVTGLIIGNPLFGGDAARFLSICFNSPNLLQKAYRSLRYFFYAPPPVIAKYANHNFALRSYALLSLLCIVSIIVFLGHTLACWLELNYRGLGVVSFLVLIVYIFLWIRSIRQKIRAFKNPQQAHGISKNVIAGKYHDISSEIMDSRPQPNIIERYLKARLGRCLSVVTVIIVMFLPYHYAAGGAAEVHPVLHQEIYSEEKGIINKVYFNGGEWLPKGTIVAEMENCRQKKDVELTRYAIDKKREEIKLLLTTPTDQEIELARQQLHASELKLKYSQDGYNRTALLYKTDVVSLITYLNAKEKMELDQQEAIERADNLLYVENQVNEHKIESTKIELAILQSELQFFEEQLERTRLRMPNDGKIVTMNLKSLEKKFLDDAQFFAEIEDYSRVQLEIFIPESDMDQVTVGNKVLFKAKQSPNKTILGKVTSIFPAMESNTTATVNKVVSVIPNEDSMLKTGMTGYAKVEGDEMFVVQAFTRTLVSFFLIEFWSWLS